MTSRKPKGASQPKRPSAASPTTPDGGEVARRRYVGSVRQMARVQAIIESNRAAEERLLVAASRVTHGSAEGEGRGVKAPPSPAIPESSGGVESRHAATGGVAGRTRDKLSQRASIQSPKAMHGEYGANTRPVGVAPGPLDLIPATPPAGTAGAIVPRPPPRRKVAPAPLFRVSPALSFSIEGVEEKRWVKALSQSAAASPIEMNSPQRASLLSRLASAVVGVFVGFIGSSFQRHQHGEGAFRVVEKTGVDRV